MKLILFPHCKIRLRLERIKRNQQYLAQLGLESTAGRSGRGGESGSAKKKHPQKKRLTAGEVASLRKRSTLSRSSKQGIDYTKEYDFRLGRLKSTKEPQAKATTDDKSKNHDGEDVPKKEVASTVPEIKIDDDNMKKNVPGDDEDDDANRKNSKKRPVNSRVPLFIYNEFKRLQKDRRLVLIRTERHVRKIQREVKHWKRQYDSYTRKKERELQTEKLLERLQKEALEERLLLGGQTKVELFKQLQQKSVELNQICFAYAYEKHNQERFKLQQQERLAELKRQQEMDRKMKMIDALDRFPKSFNVRKKNILFFVLSFIDFFLCFVCAFLSQRVHFFLSSIQNRMSLGL